MRNFDSGATRDSDDSKIDFEGHLSPLVLQAFGEYMNKHRIQADGQLRPSDNWQKGIPLDAYMKSAWRHFQDWYLIHDGYPELAREKLEDALMGLLFNVMGYTYEVKRKQNDK